jgi:hypothetical protein
MEAMTDDSLDPKLAEAARAYNQPPETPREEIWAGIEAARRKKREERKEKVLPFRRPEFSATQWAMRAAGVAALIALGIGIGRLTPRTGGPTPESVAAGPETPNRTGNVAMTLAATQHLSRAEALLTGFRTEAKADLNDAGFRSAARDLLSTTRLMLDSPDLTDVETRALLEDLELVLVQITQLRAGEGSDEIDLITEGLNQRGLMPRLRSAIPAGAVATRAQGEL